jgi:hypothetical protein
MIKTVDKCCNTLSKSCPKKRPKNKQQNSQRMSPHPLQIPTPARNLNLNPNLATRFSQMIKTVVEWRNTLSKSPLDWPEFVAGVRDMRGLGAEEPTFQAKILRKSMSL